MVTAEKILRSVASSFFSVFDFGTDIYTIIKYFEFERDAFGKLMLSFVTLSTVLQVIVVIINHRHNVRSCIMEVFWSITMIKPGLNKYRVLTNQNFPEDNKTLIPPVVELVTLKLCEVFAESIPCTLAERGRSNTRRAPRETFEHPVGANT